ncbi:DUF4870 domain-containing protein [Tepidibacillus marianensis]
MNVLLSLLVIVFVVFAIVVSVSSFHGEDYHYPMTMRLIK